MHCLIYFIHLNQLAMEQIEKELKSFNWTNASVIKILLNSNNKERLKEILPLIRRYTNAIIINYQIDLATTAQVSIGAKTIAVV
ncbi:hypothetical protein [uncultured Cytophaga sp.]|uniref:hypothetical protein n=1 Tax=uncultured Cytophaga sp. TaxID=160238 RepID=UPI002612D77F|nr:hypothetical protein [uncultured Cytophaga sp.]